jgi:hypothetical protein
LQISAYRDTRPTVRRLRPHPHPPRLAIPPQFCSHHLFGICFKVHNFLPSSCCKRPTGVATHHYRKQTMTPDSLETPVRSKLWNIIVIGVVAKSPLRFLNGIERRSLKTIHTIQFRYLRSLKMYSFLQFRSTTTVPSLYTHFIFRSVPSKMWAR